MYEESEHDLLDLLDEGYIQSLIEDEPVPVQVSIADSLTAELQVQVEHVAKRTVEMIEAIETTMIMQEVATESRAFVPNKLIEQSSSTTFYNFVATEHIVKEVLTTSEIGPVQSSYASLQAAGLPFV